MANRQKQIQNLNFDTLAEYQAAALEAGEIAFVHDQNAFYNSLGEVDLTGADDQTALEVSIVDTEDNFTGNTVEAALSELASGAGVMQTSTTFTPTLVDGANNTYTAVLQEAEYVITGNVVHISIRFNQINGNSTGGGLEITGLPSVISSKYNGSLSNPISVLSTGGSSSLQQAVVNGTRIQTYVNNSATIPVNMQFTNGNLAINGSYIIN